MENLVNGTGNNEHNCAETVPSFFGTTRPKVMLRRTNDPALRIAIKNYAANRGTQAGPMALAQLESLYAGQPTAVD